MKKLSLYGCSRFVLAGYVNSGSLYNVGDNGNLWSPVVNNSNNSYNGNFNSGGDANPDNNDNRNNGQSVRCLAR